MVKIVFAGAFATRLSESVSSLLGSGFQCVSCDELNAADSLRDAQILVSLAFTQQMSAAAPLLRLVQVPGAGLDRIDRTALGRSTWLANAYGHEVGIAEYIFGAMLTMTRGFVRLDRKMRTGEWESQWAIDQAAPPAWPQLAGKTLAVLGYGHIGQALAQRARAFDMDVWAIRQTVDGPRPPELAFLGGPQDLPTLLRQADYLAITLPLSDATRNLIGSQQLQLMKPSAYLINVARAEIVNEEALYRALDARQIAGAALDVWYRYPLASGPQQASTQAFHELDNVLMTPHIAAWTDGMLAARSALIAQNIQRVVRGEAPLNEIARLV